MKEIPLPLVVHLNEDQLVTEALLYEGEIMYKVLKLLGFPVMSPVLRNSDISYILITQTNDRIEIRYFEKLWNSSIEYTQVTVRELLKSYIFTDPKPLEFEIDPNFVYLGKPKNGFPFELQKEYAYTGYGRGGTYKGYRGDGALHYALPYDHPLIPKHVAYRIGQKPLNPQIPKKQPCLEDIFSGL